MCQTVPTQGADVRLAGVDEISPDTARIDSPCHLGSG
jgi:hypothetical protein